MEKKKKAILVVSFGTSFHKTREKTIDRIEADIAAAYPEYTLYRAWTSKMIIAKLKRRDQIVVPTVVEAVEQMIADGVHELIVQPTHIINGIENDLMKEDVLARKDAFEKIAFGDPLLTTTEDNVEVLHAVMSEFPALAEDEALVFMGHGTTHYANTVYAALDYTFKDLGYNRTFLGTVEAYPSMESLKKQLKALAPKKLILAPFMVVAGDQIGTTGTSGLALGDHLHFGILVQGEEVRPQQWMDKKWIKDNVTSVLDAAKAMIDKN